MYKRSNPFVFSTYCIFALISISILAANLFAQERYVLPVDEAKDDPSFFSFRESLVKATQNRNKMFIISILANEITNSFGGFGGIDEFKKMWKFAEGDSPFWAEFETAITNGGSFYKDSGGSRGGFCAPFSFYSFPDDLDAFEHQMIFGENVNLRAQPNLYAPIVARLSYNVVKVDYENSADDGKNESNYVWLKVTTLGGMTGFVAAEYVRSPIAYRACFEKVRGSWKMTTFVAGD